MQNRRLIVGWTFGVQTSLVLLGEGGRARTFASVEVFFIFVALQSARVDFSLRETMGSLRCRSPRETGIARLVRLEGKIAAVSAAITPSSPSEMFGRGPRLPFNAVTFLLRY